MGNIILTNNLHTVTTGNVTLRTTDALWPKTDMFVLDNLLAATHTGNATPNDFFFKYDMGAAVALKGVALCDVNFSKVAIHGHASDIWNGSPPYSPTYDSGSLAVSANPYTGRYNLFVPLTDFNLRWIAAFIPSDATAVGRYVTKWSIGSVAFLLAATALTKNMSQGFNQRIVDRVKNIEFKGGASETVDIGSALQWVGTIPFGLRTTTLEAELLTIAQMRRSQPFVFYRNAGNTSEVYICRRDTDYESTNIIDTVVRPGTIVLSEYV